MTEHEGAATARARTNIALVKYWGKRGDPRLRLPQNGSISLTLDGLDATTTVRFADGLADDALTLDGRARAGGELARVRALLDLVRARAGIEARAEVASTSTVPVAAGLASSASGFAALAVAASAAAGLDLAPRELSILARKGSGSACRSIFGGLVEWRRGERDDGADSYAEPLAAPEEWPLAMAIAVIEGGPKETGSTDGMARSVDAPGYLHWRATVEGDLAAARRAIRERDLRTLGLVAEANATKMHLAAASASPPIVYWTAATAGVVRAVARWREVDGLEGYFPVDAGPNVAVLCRPDDLAALAARLGALDGVRAVHACPAGRGAEILPAGMGRRVDA